MSDLILETVKFRNFQSFGNVWTELDLNTPGTNHIIGENLDEGGSSGAGKSTLFNVICYCLFDKIPGEDTVSKDGVINTTNQKKNTSMEAILTFSRGDDHKYVVRRMRGAETGVQLFHNDKDETPANMSRGENNFNVTIEELVGFSYNLFTKIVHFDGNARPFLSLSVGEQRNLIEELFKITVLSKKARSLKTLINDTDKTIEIQKLLNQQQEIQNETYRKHLTEIRARAASWDSQRTVDLQKIDTELSHLLTFDFESEEQLHAEVTTFEKSLTALKGEVNLLTAKQTSLTREKSPVATELALLDREVQKKKDDLKKFDTELVHLRDAKCPYCLQKFADAQAKIVELEKRTEELRAKIVEDTTKAGQLRADVDAFNVETKANAGKVHLEVQKKITEVNEVSSLLAEIKKSLNYRSLTELVTAKNRLSSLQTQLVKMVGETNPHIETIGSLETKGEVKIDYESVDALLKLQNHQQFLLKLLTDKNSYIRKNIIAKTIPFLNKRIGYYTEQLNLPHIVLFQSDMTCNISQYGRELSHSLLSKGEKKRLNLSLCLAFRDVLTYLHSKVNVLFADEVDGGSLDATLVDGLISLLKHKAWDDDITIFTISHRPEFDGRCDKTYIVRKENGFSALIEQPDT
jgi:DNA repair exonuclease SbcCD ATPase subunit